MYEKFCFDELLGGPVSIRSLEEIIAAGVLTLRGKRANQISARGQYFDGRVTCNLNFELQCTRAVRLHCSAVTGDVGHCALRALAQVIPPTPPDLLEQTNPTPAPNQVTESPL